MQIYVISVKQSVWSRLSSATHLHAGMNIKVSIKKERGIKDERKHPGDIDDFQIWLFLLVNTIFVQQVLIL